jgi:uncharacterized ferritin-like protein (DUF455 family)
VDTSAIGTIVVRGGVTLRASPARETCFRVVTDQAHMAKFPEGSPEHRREMLHGDVNEEVQSLEIAAQSLADFPDATWEVRLHLARQCWDETRHARAFLRRLLELGGRKGEFPIINQEWGVVCMFDSLAGRLAVQNRVFEGGSLDVFKEAAAVWGEWGDHATAEAFESVVADEVQHVRFANHWLERLKTEEPRALLKAIAAMSAARAWAVALTPAGVKMEHVIPVNTEDRRDAGFAFD